MASTLSLSKATVTLGDGAVEGSVSVRANVIVVKRNMTVVARAEGVTAVERHGTALEWTIRFGDGSSWEVVGKKGGCGCR
jgi:hypothetical protein